MSDEPELDAKIAAWRARMSAAMPGQEETVRELETHLRDHIEAQRRWGVAGEVALAEGVAKIGEPRVIAREFARVGTGAGGIWRPAAVIYGLIGITLLLMGWLIWSKVIGVGRGWLLAVHVLTITAGYLAVLGAGLVGLCVIVTGWRRTLTERECGLQRREILRLAVAGSGFVPLGIALGMGWSAENFGRAWSWAPVEVGALAVLISTWLLLAVVQRRVVLDDRVRAVLALLGATVVGFGWFGAEAVTAVPIAWLCAAPIFAQGAIALLHVRATRAGVRREGA